MEETLCLPIESARLDSEEEEKKEDKEEEEEEEEKEEKDEDFFIFGFDFDWYIPEFSSMTALLDTWKTSDLSKDSACWLVSLKVKGEILLLQIHPWEIVSTFTILVLALAIP